MENEQKAKQTAHLNAILRYIPNEDENGNIIDYVGVTSYMDCYKSAMLMAFRQLQLI